MFVWRVPRRSAGSLLLQETETATRRVSERWRPRDTLSPAGSRLSTPSNRETGVLRDAGCRCLQQLELRGTRCKGCSLIPPPRKHKPITGAFFSPCSKAYSLGLMHFVARCLWAEYRRIRFSSFFKISLKRSYRYGFKAAQLPFAVLMHSSCSRLVVLPSRIRFPRPSAFQIHKGLLDCNCPHPGSAEPLASLSSFSIGQCVTEQVVLPPGNPNKSFHTVVKHKILESLSKSAREDTSIRMNYVSYPSGFDFAFKLYPLCQLFSHGSPAGLASSLIALQFCQIFGSAL